MINIRDPLHGSILMSEGESKVIDTSEFQRLRFVKQLGFTELSFPGATHSRFIHSVGACHLSQIAFNNTFKNLENIRTSTKYNQVIRLATLLHDVGHGPLSHVTERVMPSLESLNLDFIAPYFAQERQAHHEDYTVKLIMDSSITSVIEEYFECQPIHVACLINKGIESPDDFFLVEGVDVRPVLSQIVSSELDVDRMDYLVRDAYYCGTQYGKIEMDWLLSNLMAYRKGSKYYLAMDRKAIYAFDDFLLSRHHMYMMVYDHHKSVVYEKMLYKYLDSPDCNLKLPGDVDSYIKCTDHWLYQNLAESNNKWAKKITEKKPYFRVKEFHATMKRPDETDEAIECFKKQLDDNAIDYIFSQTKNNFSHYYSENGIADDSTFSLLVVDTKDPNFQAIPIEQCTGIFKKYAEDRKVSRFYTDKKDYHRAYQVFYPSSTREKISKPLYLAD